MTDAERRATEWLLEAGTGHETIETNSRYRSTVFAMLSRPVLPEDRDGSKAFEDLLQAIREEDPRVNAWCIYRAIHAHLTKPKTKTVWRVSFFRQAGGGEDGGGDEHDAFPADHLKRLADEGYTIKIERREVKA